MPGPGGGSGGGGFGGGGSRGGGGFGGGGFGGGPRPGGFGGGPYHRPPRGPRFGFGPRYHYFGPRYYYGGGGGCLGGLIGMIMIPIVFLLVAVILFTSSIGPAVTAFTKGGVVQYDEMQFQHYADAQYRAEFGSSTAYEDNILIVFLTDEARDRYYCIAWVGDHLDTDVRDLFGGLYSPFGRAIESSVNATNYSYSLDTDLARAVEIMEKSVTKLGFTSNFRCKEDHVQVESHLTNRTQLALTNATVNYALRSFTENTEIPIVIVVAEMEAVFGKTMPMQYVLTLLLSVIFVGVAIYLIVRAVKASRNRKKGGGSNGNGENRNGSSGSENRSRYDGGRTDFH